LGNAGNLGLAFVAFQAPAFEVKDSGNFKLCWKRMKINNFWDLSSLMPLFCEISW